MNDFLPQGTKVPASPSNYMKFLKGKNKFRAVSSAVVGYEYWSNENKPVRLKEYPQELPKDIRVEESGKMSEIKYFWAFAVIDRADQKVKVLEITQKGILRELESLVQNEDWGSPKEYDVNVERTGDGLKTEYTVQPSPHKPLTEEEKTLIKETPVNLEALFFGGDPFDKLSQPQEVQAFEVPTGQQSDDDYIDVPNIEDIDLSKR